MESGIKQKANWLKTSVNFGVFGFRLEFWAKENEKSRTCDDGRSQIKKAKDGELRCSALHKPI